MVTIENDILKIDIKSLGAELTSVKNKNSDWEYLWCGDAKYWGRQAPILFPFVGLVKNKEFFVDGIKYPMTQHGFARDSEFEIIHSSKNSAWFRLESSLDTKKIYPFDFALEIGYTLDRNTLKVIWKVTNKDSRILPFSIGGHPAFNLPMKANKNQSDCYIMTDANDKLNISCINMDNGLKIDHKNYNLGLEQDGSFKITENMFDNDALVIENGQVHRLSLVHSDKKPYITVDFQNMPLCGIWSPARKNAPFVCIEPWCGRCDSEGYQGDIYHREYGNILEPGQVFERFYTVSFS